MLDLLERRAIRRNAERALNVEQIMQQMRPRMSILPNMQQEYMNILRNAAMYDSFLVRFIEQAQKENRTEDVKVIAGVRSLMVIHMR